MVNYSKWMIKHNTYPLLYSRHPDTGSKKYQSAYVWVYNSQTDITLIRLYESNGWTYLRKEGCRLVFFKESE